MAPAGARLLRSAVTDRWAERWQEVNDAFDVFADGFPVTVPQDRLALDVQLPPRVLVRTCVKAPTEWSPSFCAFAPETISWLAGLGVRLIGIDSQSVDPADSKTLESHQQLLAHDMRVLENLVLDEVPAGPYDERLDAVATERGVIICKDA